MPKKTGTQRSAAFKAKVALETLQEQHPIAELPRRYKALSHTSTSGAERS